MSICLVDAADQEEGASSWSAGGLLWTGESAYGWPRAGGAGDACVVGGSILRTRLSGEPQLDPSCRRRLFEIDWSER